MTEKKSRPCAGTQERQTKNIHKHYNTATLETLVCILGNCLAVALVLTRSHILLAAVAATMAVGVALETARGV